MFHRFSFTRTELGPTIFWILVPSLPVCFFSSFFCFVSVVWFTQSPLRTNQSWVTGAVGGGLNANVCEAYWFIANNWEEGDEIFLFGFSRGAYTARAVAGLIGNIGILGRRELHKFQDIYEMYMHRNEDPTEWKKFLDGIPRKATGVPIKVVGVFDTVGSVGIPDNFVVNAFGGNKKYHFHDTELSSRKL